SFAVGIHAITLSVSDPSSCLATCSTTVDVRPSVVLTHPQINIVKTTNNTNNDSAPGIQVLAGSTVTWTYIVTNPGSEPLKNVTVTDSVVGSITGLTGGDANNNGLLDPGETWTYTKGAVVVLGQYENIGTANGTGNVTNKPVTSSNPDHYFGEPWATPCPDGVFSYGSDGNVIDPATGDLKITYDQFPAPNDNSYGVNAIGWPNGHIFKDLVQSDHAGFQVLNPSKTVMLSFDIDYLTATPVTADAPS